MKIDSKKLLLGLNYTIFNYCIWNALLNLVSKNSANWGILIIGFASSMLYNHFVNANESNNKMKCMTVAFSLVLLLIIYVLKLNIVNIIFLITNMMIIYYDQKKNMTYPTYQQVLQMNMIILGTVGIFASILEGDTSIVIIYTVYIIVSLILMRSMRRAYFGISEKKSKKVDGIIIVAALVLSNNTIASRIVNMIFVVINNVGNVIIGFLALIATPIFNLFFALFNIKDPSIKNKIAKYTMRQPDKIPDNMQHSPPNYLLGAVIKVLLILAIILIMYRLYNVYYKKGVSNDSLKEDDIEKETITVSNSENKGFWKNVFNYQGIKGKIMKYYQTILIAANDLGVYKKSMSAGDLYNEVKHTVDKRSIANVTDIYNETKFSNHDREVNLKEFLKDAKSIRKKLKEMYKK